MRKLVGVSKVNFNWEFHPELFHGIRDRHEATIRLWCLWATSAPFAFWFDVWIVTRPNSQHGQTSPRVFARRINGQKEKEKTSCLWWRTNAIPAKHSRWTICGLKTSENVSSKSPMTNHVENLLDWKLIESNLRDVFNLCDRFLLQFSAMWNRLLHNADGSGAGMWFGGLREATPMMVIRIKRTVGSEEWLSRPWACNPSHMIAFNRNQSNRLILLRTEPPSHPLDDGLDDHFLHALPHRQMSQRHTIWPTHRYDIQTASLAQLTNRSRWRRTSIRIRLNATSTSNYDD